MSRCTTLVVVLLLALAPSNGRASDRNWWPLKVEQDAQPGPSNDWLALGPLGFLQSLPAGRSATGVRPFYVLRRDASGQREGGSALYPLFRWEHQPNGLSWTVLNLVNHRRVDGPGEAADLRSLDVWPFYFSRQTGEPSTSYRAVFPIYGDVPQRFGQDRWKWVLFPLYGRFEENGVTTTTVPWPFIKVLRGDGNHGFELWPLAGRREKPGVYRAEFALWPLLYRSVSGLDQPEPQVQAGFLPFYALDRRPGYVSETFGWPFWGYVHRTEPYAYHARHYFWPIWVQGRGDDRYVNRWGPFYSHSNIKGLEKRWVLWPFWHHRTWTEAGLEHERRQFLYFLYYSNLQRRPNSTAGEAEKTHLWPLISAWDNGAGRKQVQMPSPLEVFFPNNEHVRLTWSPLFALYRFNQTAPGEVRHSLLWDGITYERSTSNGTREFHLGPILSVESQPEERRIALFNLLGLERREGRGWRFFFGKDSPAPAPADATSP